MLKFSIKNIIDNDNEKCIIEKGFNNQTRINPDYLNSDKSIDRAMNFGTSTNSSVKQNLPPSQIFNSAEEKRINVPHSSSCSNFSNNSPTFSNIPNVFQAFINDHHNIKNYSEYQNLLPKQSNGILEMNTLQNFQIYQYQLLISNARLHSIHNKVLSNEELHDKLSKLLDDSYSNTRVNNNLTNEKDYDKKNKNELNKRTIDSYLPPSIHEKAEYKNLVPNFCYSNLFNSCSQTAFLSDSNNLHSNKITYQPICDNQNNDKALSLSDTDKFNAKKTENNKNKRTSEGASDKQYYDKSDETSKKLDCLNSNNSIITCIENSKKNKKIKKITENHESKSNDQMYKIHFKLKKNFSNKKGFLCKKRREKNSYKNKIEVKNNETVELERNQSQKLLIKQVNQIKKEEKPLSPNVHSLYKNKNYPCSECGKVCF
jgi:hypothetical protein